jgi:pilus assembly protein CpaB
MLQPGDRIDLLFTARPPLDGDGGAQPPEATVPLFQGLLVLATGKQVRAGVDERAGSRSFSTVTVEVEPEHAQRLVVAQRAGRLTAVLRNPDDLQRMSRKPMDVRQLLGVGGPSLDGQPPQLIVGGVGRLAPHLSPADEAASVPTSSPDAATNGAARGTHGGGASNAARRSR